jgi:transposase
MTRFVQGEDRTQATLLPELLDDYVTADNPVRVIEVFVEELNLGKLGFDGIDPASTGRPAYHPATMLKIYLYGYLNRIQSSRRLERETQRNIELMWLTGRLTPDFKTIANFRKDNGRAIRNVCRQFIALCRQLDLFTQTLVAIDGSKFKAVNNRDRNFTSAKVKRRMEQIDESIERYLAAMDTADRAEPSVAQPKIARLQDKISMLKQQMQQLKDIEVQMNAAPDKQISLTDPDARSMATSGRGSGMVGYNVQTAVDTKHHLIVAHEVTNVGHDRHALATMAQQASAAVGNEDLTVIADRGYFSGEEILACEEAGITPFVAKPLTSGSKADGRFGKQDFIYIDQDDEYRCPANQRLIKRFTTVENGLNLNVYWSSACQGCAIRAQCTTGKERRVRRWEHEAVVDAMQARLDRDPEKMSVRRQTVEHPFGTIKSWMGSTHFQMRTLKRVSTEMSLHVLAYNIKRVMQILGIGPMLEAIRAGLRALLTCRIARHAPRPS